MTRILQEFKKKRCNLSLRLQAEPKIVAESVVGKEKTKLSKIGRASTEESENRIAMHEKCFFFCWKIFGTISVLRRTRRVLKLVSEKDRRFLFIRDS